MNTKIEDRQGFKISKIVILVLAAIIVLQLIGLGAKLTVQTIDLGSFFKESFEVVDEEWDEENQQMKVKVKVPDMVKLVKKHGKDKKAIQRDLENGNYETITKVVYVKPDQNPDQKPDPVEPTKDEIVQELVEEAMKELEVEDEFEEDWEGLE